MKKIIILIITLFLCACTSTVSMVKLAGIGPGMSCDEFDSYLAKEKLSFKKMGDVYKFRLDGSIWSDAGIKCDRVITQLAFNSVRGSAPRYSRIYNDVQQLLLKAFKDSKITYEEGERTIDLGNGIRLYQFTDSAAGIIVGFRVTIDNREEAGAAWRVAGPLLSKLGD